MTIEKNLEERLRNLRHNARTGKIVIESLGGSLPEISDYLSAERIYHCTLPSHDKIVLAYANYKEIREIDRQYSVEITTRLEDGAGKDALVKLDTSVPFAPRHIGGKAAPVSPGMIYDLRNRKVSGTVTHTDLFAPARYGLAPLVGGITFFEGTFGTLLEIAMDKEVISVSAPSHDQMR